MVATARLGCCYRRLVKSHESIQERLINGHDFHMFVWGVVCVPLGSDASEEFAKMLGSDLSGSDELQPSVSAPSGCFVHKLIIFSYKTNSLVRLEYSIRAVILKKVKECVFSRANTAWSRWQTHGDEKEAPPIGDALPPPPPCLSTCCMKAPISDQLQRWPAIL